MDSCTAFSSVPRTHLLSVPTAIHTSPLAVRRAEEPGSTRMVLENDWSVIQSCKIAAVVSTDTYIGGLETHTPVLVDDDRWPVDAVVT